MNGHRRLPEPAARMIALSTVLGEPGSTSVDASVMTFSFMDYVGSAGRKTQFLYEISTENILPFSYCDRQPRALLLFGACR